MSRWYQSHGGDMHWQTSFHCFRRKAAGSTASILASFPVIPPTLSVTLVASVCFWTQGFISRTSFPTAGGSDGININISWEWPLFKGFQASVHQYNPTPLPFWGWVWGFVFGPSHFPVRLASFTSWESGSVGRSLSVTYRSAPSPICWRKSLWSINKLFALLEFLI